MRPTGWSDSIHRATAPDPPAASPHGAGVHPPKLSQDSEPPLALGSEVTPLCLSLLPRQGRAGQGRDLPPGKRRRGKARNTREPDQPRQRWAFACVGFA